jgi:hypothetical protein
VNAVSFKKEFHVLGFYLWRIKEISRDEWREEIYLSATDEALDIIIQSLTEVLSTLDQYGKGTRKFKCNPPEDLDFNTYGEEHCVKFQWLDWFIVKVSKETTEERPAELDGCNVTLHLGAESLREFIKVAKKHYTTYEQYAHGRNVAGGLRFSPDWLGIE